MRLTRLDRNKVFEAIAKSSIDPAECKLSGIGHAGMIVHESGSTFTFDESEEGGFWASATVEDGSERVIEGPGIDDVLDAIPEWADEIRQVAETPDYWAEMRRSRELIVAIQHEDSGNAPFTQDEQRQLTTLFHEIAHALAENSELTSEQMERIEERLDEAAEASKRMGRKDWFVYFLGTITALIITATVVGGVGEQIITMVIHSLGHLFTGGNEPPERPPRVLA